MDSQALAIAVTALRYIAPEIECESFTSGIGSCFRNGRTVDAIDSADRCCNSCIAHDALERVNNLLGDEALSNAAKRLSRGSKGSVLIWIVLFAAMLLVSNKGTFAYQVKPKGIKAPISRPVVITTFAIQSNIDRAFLYAPDRFLGKDLLGDKVSLFPGNHHLLFHGVQLPLHSLALLLHFIPLPEIDNSLNNNSDQQQRVQRTIRDEFGALLHIDVKDTDSGKRDDQRDREDSNTPSYWDSVKERLGGAKGIAIAASAAVVILACVLLLFHELNLALKPKDVKK